MKSKKILAAVLAALMALLNLAAALPAFAAGANETGYATPDGYDDHDYQAMVAFLLEENEQGVKNHETLDAMSNFYSYDPADPATWGSVVYEDVQEGYVMFNGVIWTDEPVKRIRGVCWEIEGDFPAGAYPLYGSLDLSDCGALTYLTLTQAYHIDSIRVDGCSALKSFWTSRCGIRELDMTGCVSLAYFTCGYDEITRVNISDCAMLEEMQCNGTLITGIDVSNCPRLKFLNVTDNRLVSLDVSNCRELDRLFCDYNELTELNAAGLGRLNYLQCNNNSISSLNVTGCPELGNLYCQNNRLSALDLSDNPNLYFKSVSVEGSGFVGYKAGYYVGCDNAIAEPKPGAEFIGWYDENGGFISAEPILLKNDTDKINVTARFTEAPAVPGDVDGSGSVTANDALLVLRAALGLIDGIDASVADVDGTGTVTANDALMILRCALGISEL